MTKIFKTLLLVLVLSMSVGTASAAVIVFDFEGEATTGQTGALTSLTLTEGGLSVTITREGAEDRFDIIDLDSAPEWGDRSLNPFIDVFEPSIFRAEFSAPILGASIQFADFGPSDDDTPVELDAFNLANVLVDSSTGVWVGSDSLPDFSSLSVSGVGIRAIEFTSSINATFPNSLFWDNLTVRTGDAPEPATTALLGLGALALVGIRRRRF